VISLCYVVLQLGTHHGAVTHDHLDYYLDEFTFGSTVGAHAAAASCSFALAHQAVVVDPAPYESLVKYARFSS
jgi:hypothetical protein